MGMLRLRHEAFCHINVSVRVELEAPGLMETETDDRLQFVDRSTQIKDTQVSMNLTVAHPPALCC